MKILLMLVILSSCSFEKSGALHKEDTRQMIINQNRFFNIGDGYDVWTKTVNKEVGSFGKPNAVANIKKKIGDRPLYTARYTFDHRGRRTTLGQKKAKKLAFIFGDSMAFGEGLEDGDTFASNLSKKSNDYRVINYGFPGHGPSNMLAFMQFGDVKEVVKNRQTDIFFIFRDDAVMTVNGLMSWGGGHPYYRSDGKHFRYMGTFNENKISRKSLHLSSEFSPEEISRTAGIIKETEYELVQLNPLNRLFVVFIPLAFSTPRMLAYLEKLKVKTINLSEIDVEYIAFPESRFLDGIHTGRTNEILTEAVIYALEGGNFKAEKTKMDEFTLSTIEGRSDLLKELKIQCFRINYHDTIPVDDTRDMISRLLDFVNKKKSYRMDELLRICKRHFDVKKKIIDDIKMKLFSSKPIFDQRCGRKNPIALSDFIHKLDLLKEVDTLIAEYLYNHYYRFAFKDCINH